MTRKQLCTLAAVTALFLLSALAVWKLGQVPTDDTGGSGDLTAIFTSSIVLYLAYLFSTLLGRSKNRK